MRLRKPRKPFWDNVVGAIAIITINGARALYFGLALILLRPKKPQ
jgi:hypothetical protein